MAGAGPLGVSWLTLALIAAAVLVPFMVTLALAQLPFFFYVQASGFSGGEDGIQAVPRGRLFGLIDLEQPLAIYYLVLAICLAG